MSNPAYGYSDVPERSAVRISDNGEFIHQNHTVADQGVVNVSHGWVNLSAQSVQACFQSAIYGDPVEVTGTACSCPPPTGTSTTGRLAGINGKPSGSPDRRPAAVDVPRRLGTVTVGYRSPHLGNHPGLPVRGATISAQACSDCRSAVINRSCSAGGTDPGLVNDRRTAAANASRALPAATCATDIGSSAPAPAIPPS